VPLPEAHAISRFRVPRIGSRCLRVRYAIEKDHVIFEPENGEPRACKSRIYDRAGSDKSASCANRAFKIRRALWASCCKVAPSAASDCWNTPSSRSDAHRQGLALCGRRLLEWWGGGCWGGLVGGGGGGWGSLKGRPVRYEGNVLIGKRVRRGLQLGSLIVRGPCNEPALPRFEARRQIRNHCARADDMAISAQNEFGEWTCNRTAK